ncbi:hypothetical protein [Burkholderia plantarii]|uniref:hypothetical protein n=1 Tax=Burkholderia plantarii TaxID=41899 RepID=UPI0018DB1A8B|nr:hypothetical protein [Burkholderia plantarii]MBI0325483.1 hypothetical protein [Burkholderia plantarii]
MSWIFILPSLLFSESVMSQGPDKSTSLIYGYKKIVPGRKVVAVPLLYPLALYIRKARLTLHCMYS